ncbi:MAG: hypothetical protein RBS17_07525 [Coriobacteriia bacterium]|nr:hypothetical protein [Coriobacteriia bacterium]
MILHTLSNTLVTLIHSTQEFEFSQTDETIGRDQIEIEFPDGSLIRVNLATGDETLGTWARVFVRVQGETNITTDVFDEGGSR